MAVVNCNLCEAEYDLNDVPHKFLNLRGMCCPRCGEYQPEIRIITLKDGRKISASVGTLCAFGGESSLINLLCPEPSSDDEKHLEAARENTERLEREGML